MIRLGACLLLVVAGCRAAAAPADVRDGKLVLTPVGPRQLVCEGDDVEPALTALRAFLGALPKDKVAHWALGTARLVVDTPRPVIVDLFWDLDGEHGTLRIVALAADPHEPDDPAIDVVTAIERWFGVHGISAGRVDRSPLCFRKVDATCVRTPDAPLRMAIGDAAAEEFRTRGLDLKQEEILVDSGCALARGPGKEVLWSIFWDTDHSREGGTWAVRHHANPFDTKGEQEVLLAIFRRATGLEPTVAEVPDASW